jgi:hypothetical protein
MDAILPPGKQCGVSNTSDRWASESIHSHGNLQQRCQPPPKPNAWANEPKPPRLTELAPEADDDDEPPPDEESPLKKLLRDDQMPPLPPWPPYDDALRGAQSAPGCGTADAAMPGDGGCVGWQLLRGIIA